MSAYMNPSFPVHLGVRIFVVENLGQLLDGLPLPLRDLVRAELVLRSQFGNGPMAAGIVTIIKNRLNLLLAVRLAIESGHSDHQRVTTISL